MDVLTQVVAVEGVVEALGYPAVRLPFTRDLSPFIQMIREKKIDMVLNLCETVDEDATLAGHPATVLELLGVPFSGSPSVALVLTTDKLITKRLLVSCGIATPKYDVYNAMEPFRVAGLRYPVIVKPRFEDASIGIDQDSIFQTESQLKRGLSKLSERFQALLIEEYIEGREFNVSLFGYPSVSTLPVAEIDFSGLPNHLYAIVGYRAKWDKTSIEYYHTPRRFSHDLPATVLTAMKRTAMDCFRLFMLRDYGRVDMRVDGQGKCYVLEVNANPCLSPDAGFAAAAEQAGMTYADMVGGFVSFVSQRFQEDGRQASGASG